MSLKVIGTGFDPAGTTGLQAGLGPLPKATINDYLGNRLHDRDHLIQRFEAHAAAMRNTAATRDIITRVMAGEIA